MEKGPIVEAVRAERRRTLALLHQLPPERFDTPTALPGWRVREVVAHLLSTDRAALTGAILPVMISSPESLEAWNDRQVPRWANRPVPELLDGLERWGRRFGWLAAALPAMLYRPRIPTHWGRAPAGTAIWARAYDEWIHRQDIRRALGMADESEGLEAAAEFALSAIGTDTLPRLRLGNGPIEVSLRGVAAPAWRYDPGSGSFGPAGSPREAPTSRIVAEAPAFLMTVAGRGSFEDLEDQGMMSIEGDAAPARELLADVRIV